VGRKSNELENGEDKNQELQEDKLVKECSQMGKKKQAEAKVPLIRIKGCRGGKRHMRKNEISTDEEDMREGLITPQEKRFISRCDKWKELPCEKAQKVCQSKANEVGNH